jgi:3-oxoacyl-[acyl-carrier-protein] synthase-1
MSEQNVVIVGAGAITPFGNTLEEINTKMYAGESGIVSAPPEYDEVGVKSKVCGHIACDYADLFDRQNLRNAGTHGGMAYYASVEALKQAGLMSEGGDKDELVTSDRAGVFIGSGGPPMQEIMEHADRMRSGKLSPRDDPYAVQRTMSNTAAANVATALKMKGGGVSLSSACATALHNVGAAANAVQQGKLDLALAGGVDRACPYTARMFDIPKALSRRRNETPTAASRPFDADRDGFVISGGSGVVALASEAFAQERGLPVIGRLVGWADTSDGDNMTVPSGEGAKRAMRLALRGLHLSQVDLISAHATSTPIGDPAEAKAILDVFGAHRPLVNAAKSMVGHGLGAAGAWALIMVLLQMKHGYVHESLNIECVDEKCRKLNIARERIVTPVNLALINAFGFGGANAAVAVMAP